MFEQKTGDFSLFRNIFTTIIFFVVLSVGVLTNLEAQVLNTYGLELNADTTDRFKGAVGFGVNVLKQNTTITSISGSADFSVLFKPYHQLALNSRYSLLREDGENIINTGYVNLRARFMTNKLLNPEVFVQAQLAAVIGLQERYLVGSNLRFRVREEKKSRIYVGIGVMAEREIWSDSGVRDEVTRPYTTICREGPCTVDLIKFNTYLSIFQKISESATVNSTIFYQAVPDVNFIEPRVAGDVSVSLKIIKSLSYNIQFAWMYDADPPFPIDNFYYNFTNSIAFSW